MLTTSICSKKIGRCILKDCIKYLVIWNYATGTPIKIIGEITVGGHTQDQIEQLTPVQWPSKKDDHTHDAWYPTIESFPYASDGISGESLAKLSFSPDEKYLAHANTLYRVDDKKIAFDPKLIPLLEYLYAGQEKHQFKQRHLEQETWRRLQQLDPFSRAAFMQNLNLLPPKEKTSEEKKS